MTLSNNELTRLPGGLTRLVALNECWLKDNNLGSHPFRPGLLPNLRVLLVDMGVSVV